MDWRIDFHTAAAANIADAVEKRQNECAMLLFQYFPALMVTAVELIFFCCSHSRSPTTKGIWPKCKCEKKSVRNRMTERGRIFAEREQKELVQNIRFVVHVEVWMWKAAQIRACWTKYRTKRTAWNWLNSYIDCLWKKGLAGALPATATNIRSKRWHKNIFCKINN